LLGTTKKDAVIAVAPVIAPPIEDASHRAWRWRSISAAAMKSYVEGALALVLYCSRLSDIASSADSPDEADSATSLLDLLTPVAKSWPSQWCLEANDLAIQVHGGYGYTREYDVEQHYRDNLLNPIHEGTHGIRVSTY
jgi:alkylation response protein AidB-like acyl-CoA dehydrogenase